MIQSMTGFGRCQKTLGSRDITVEIKAVNHRYLEFSSRLPRSLGFIEDKLKAQVQSRIARGKVEVSVTVAEQKGSASRVTLNEGLALSYLEELRIFARKNGLTDDLTLSDFCRLPDLFTTRMAEVDEDALWRDISETADGALDSFIAMRRREGEKLSADLAAKLYNILTLVEAVERRSPETVEAYRQRLYKKLGELLGRTVRLTTAGCSPKQPCLRTRWQWTRKQSGCAAISISSGISSPWRNRWAASSISWCRR